MEQDFYDPEDPEEWSVRGLLESMEALEKLKANEHFGVLLHQVEIEEVNE